MCLSAVDYPKETPPRFEVVYHLFSYTHGTPSCSRSTCRARTPRCRRSRASGPWPTGTSARPSTCSASLFTGHSDLRRILLPDDWEGHPLRKDWVDPDFYNGMHVKPTQQMAERAMAGEPIGVGPFDETPPNRHVRRVMGAAGSTSGPERHRAMPEDLDTDEMILNMGPQHPSTHGVLRLELRTDGEIVKAARPHIGYLHRCFEKHGENVDYPGVIPYTDRMDYVAAMNNYLGYALAVEKLMGIEVSPGRPDHPRDHGRAAAHRQPLVAIGTYGLDIGAFTPVPPLLRDREKILDLFEWTCGARLLYNYNWVGGVSHDLPDGFVKACRDFLEEFDAVTFPEMMDLLIGNKIFVKRTAGVGVLRRSWPSPTTSPGPTCAAAACAATSARTTPTRVTSRYDFDIPVGEGRVRARSGRAYDRNWVRAIEMRESARILHQAARPPREDGEGRRAGEGAQAGQAGQGRGLRPHARPRAGPARLLHRRRRHGVNPYRVKVKSPCFTAMSVFHVLGQGDDNRRHQSRSSARSTSCWGKSTDEARGRRTSS